MTDNQLTPVRVGMRAGRVPNLLAWVQSFAKDLKTVARELPQTLDAARRRREREEGMRQAEAKRALAAERIDLKTCHRLFQYVDLADPDGEDPDPVGACIGRMYYLGHPNIGLWAEEHLVRPLHPEITDREWDALMTAAHDRAYGDLPL